MEEVVNLAALEGSVDFSMMGMFLKSDWVVKFVIILLVIFSIQSWKTIIQKILLINKIKKISKKFENHFWSGVSLDELYQQIDDFDQESFSNIFRNIMNEYEKSRMQKNKVDFGASYTTDTIFPPFRPFRICHQKTRPVNIRVIYIPCKGSSAKKSLCSSSRGLR